jgi:hypothetical protein
MLILLLGLVAPAFVTNPTPLSQRVLTSGAVAEPYLTGLPHPAGVCRNVFEGANVGDAFLRNTAKLKWQIINIEDPLYTPFPGGRGPFNEDAPAPE